MSSKNGQRLKQDEDSRALWERPVIRRLATKDAEHSGLMHDDGTCTSGEGGTHSCKFT
jgi:hypothetical protein